MSGCSPGRELRTVSKAAYGDDSALDTTQAARSREKDGDQDLGEDAKPDPEVRW